MRESVRGWLIVGRVAGISLIAWAVLIGAVVACI